MLGLDKTRNKRNTGTPTSEVKVEDIEPQNTGPLRNLTWIWGITTSGVFETKEKLHTAR